MVDFTLSVIMRTCLMTGMMTTSLLIYMELIKRMMNT